MVSPLEVSWLRMHLTIWTYAEWLFGHHLVNKRWYVRYDYNPSDALSTIVMIEDTAAL